VILLSVIEQGIFERLPISDIRQERIIENIYWTGDLRLSAKTALARIRQEQDHQTA